MKKNIYAGQQQTGVIKRHPDGFGFFISDDLDFPDVYIPKHSMKTAMSNDRVVIEVYPEGKGGDRWRGDILDILERRTQTVVGLYHQLNEKEGMLVDESHSWGRNLLIKMEDAGGAKEKELVAVDITEYPDEKGRLRGRVLRVIGDAEDPLNDIHRVIYSHSIPDVFSTEVENEVKGLSEEVSEADMQGRKDLRDLPFITIDGVSAKDFDDAIYVETRSNGFHLWVAIADVSHYVKPGAAIDESAVERGTSSYFPNFVVPMLPEILSNGLCSLKPNVPRLALVCQMHLDFSGEVQSYSFYEAVIKSHARVTYGGAQEVIDGESVEELEEVKNEIMRAADLAKLLMAKRFKQGSLDLDIPETEVIVDELGRPVDIIKSERIFAHRLIEELMLVANVAAARYLHEKEVPALYRIHEPPDGEAIAMLDRYLHNFGSRKKIQGGLLQKKLTKALQEFANQPQAQILNILTLRSMNQAKYSAENCGHFGLAFDYYTHFTSPIRRYPDLIIHRLIKSTLLPEKYSAMDEEDLHTSGVMLSACEQRAVKAERQLVSIKKARFMLPHVGDTFEGIISSVAKFGLFVLLREYDVDGRVAIEDLGNDRWEFDEEQLIIVGKRSGVVYRIGDTLEVVVAQADVESGKIDFMIKGIERNASVKNRKADRDDTKERRPTKKNSRGVRSSRVSKRRRKT